MQDSLDKTLITNHLSPAFPGTILIKQKTDSTNIDAKLLAQDNDVLYSTVIAETQTAGRGRIEGRSFYSPPGTGIYLSIILPHNGRDILKITPAVAVAVCQTIEEFTDVKPEIKWVNDILMRGKKVCGILCESIPNTSMVIAGIGINFSTSTFPDTIVDVAGSVFTNPQISRNEFIGRLLTRLHEISLAYDRCISEYRTRSCVLGKSIRYQENNIWHSAVAKDIDENGGLVVCENGTVKTLMSGEISLRISEK